MKAENRMQNLIIENISLNIYLVVGKIIVIIFICKNKTKKRNKKHFQRKIILYLNKMINKRKNYEKKKRLVFDSFTQCGF